MEFFLLSFILAGFIILIIFTLRDRRKNNTVDVIKEKSNHHQKTSQDDKKKLPIINEQQAVKIVETNVKKQAVVECDSITGIYAVVRVYSDEAAEISWQLDYKRISARIKKDYEGDWTINLIYANLQLYEVNNVDKYYFLKYENEFTLLIYACLKALYRTQQSKNFLNRLCMISPDIWIRENVLPKSEQIMNNKKFNIFVKVCRENDAFGVAGVQLKNDSWIGEQPPTT